MNVGQVIGRKYKVERVLGEGGMGIVVAARHITVGELHAVKIMRPEMVGHHNGVQRFLQEASAAARLKSHHAVRVHDVDTDASGAPYIAMEYLDGIDLKRLLERDGPLSVVVASTYVLEACEAIAEAHAAGIIHRDIKPANMFLWSGAFDVPVIKVLDFGIAKVLAPSGAAPAGSQLTSTHAIMGSPAFMSPEQATASRCVDARADIWSLGVVLYNLITGALPFDGPDRHDLFKAILTAPPRSLSSFGLHVQPAFEAIIVRCLEKDIRARFQSVGELAAALLPFAEKPKRVSLPTEVAPPAQQRVGGSTPTGTLVMDQDSTPTLTTPRAETPKLGVQRGPGSPRSAPADADFVGSERMKRRVMAVMLALGGAVLLVAMLVIIPAGSNQDVPAAPSASPAPSVNPSMSAKPTASGDGAPLPSGSAPVAPEIAPAASAPGGGPTEDLDLGGVLAPSPVSPIRPTSSSSRGTSLVTREKASPTPAPAKSAEER